MRFLGIFAPVALRVQNSKGDFVSRVQPTSFPCAALCCAVCPPVIREVSLCRVELSRRGFPRNGWKQFEQKNTHQWKFVCFHDFFPNTLAHQILLSPPEMRGELL